MKSKLALGILLGIVLLCGSDLVAQENRTEQDNSEVKTTTTILERNKETVRRLFEDFLNTGKLESLDQIIAKEYPGIAGKKGPSAFAETIKELRISFPDIRWTIEDVIAEGDRVVARWHWQGTHKNSFRSFPASQKQITGQGIAIFSLKDDKIVGAWIQTDRLGFFQQIGAVSPNVGAPTQSQKRK